ncbi:haloacid dehalogenase [Stereum hirsutum FP-91666 SS1]|uniref:haloacid dehalogenase n=1 Tax=Stereum hirsutum (strain FP-91666) TaxID=721885 RepID=UPI0004449245|nr:haloacid dehalogenase [Stereum hirsutum FP-91666 SS1]EIM83943.1 haloacid dehalogenase [Stereum hirsutum FP-91666 SS1]
MTSVHQVLAFDVYGTLLDTSSISKVLEEKLQVSREKAAEVAITWRKHQLEYTWRLNSMELYEPFDEVTRRSLINATIEHGFDISNSDAEDICGAYQTLGAFKDAFDALQALKEKNNIKITVFSNGTQDMVSNSLDAAGVSPFVEGQHLTDNVKRYKPSPAVYQDLLQSLGKTNEPQNVWLVSGNPFDVCGARSSGMRAIWVDRVGKGWADRLLEPNVGGPTKIVRSLREVKAIVDEIA